MITIPTITQLYTAILADLTAKFGDSIPSFGKNFLRAIAMAQAGRLKLYYLAIGNLQKNIFVDTADPEASGGTLERFGRVKLNRDPFPATAGQYTIQVTGSIGATINSSTTFRSNDDALSPGMLFVLDNTHVLTATTDSITVRALTPGLDSKLQVGDGLVATAPILNVNSAATVTAETVEPLAAETVEEYRAIVLQSYRLEPNGGAASDYRLWAADAQGVQQVYPFAKSGSANEINLYVEATLADSIDGKGTPSALLLTTVESVVELDPDTTQPINDRGRRPLGVFQIHYLPVTVVNVNINIASFVGVTADQKTLIFNAIKEALVSVRPFVAGADILAQKNDIFSTNSVISIILTAIPGSIFGAITLTVGGSPVSSYQFVNGNIPYLNLITYS